MWMYNMLFFSTAGPPGARIRRDSDSLPDWNDAI